MNGGDGIDTVSYEGSNAAVAINLGVAGQTSSGHGTGDYIYNVENLVGSSYSDNLTGDGNANHIWGGYIYGADVISGGGGNDTLDGEADNDNLSGDDGDDVLIGGLGADTMNGGAGTDWASYETSTNSGGVKMNLTTTVGATGDAIGDTFANIENILGSAFGDNLTGDSNANEIRAGAGVDVLNGGDGNDTLDGGTGSDQLHGGNGTDIASYALATEAFVADLGVSSNNTGDAYGDTYDNIECLTGSAYNDSLVGDTIANILTGNNGSDTLDGGDGNDTLVGGGGDDSLEGGAGTDIAAYSGSISEYSITVDSNGLPTSVTHLTGSDGTDTLVNVEQLLFSSGTFLAGTSGADTIDGSANSSNYIFGLAGNDSLLGGAGADTLDGGSGQDTMTGGDGDDVYYVDNTSDLVTEVANQGTDTVYASVTYTLTAKVENLSLTGTSNIDGSGTNGDNSVTGNSGNNILNGYDGNDTINGGDGNDTIAGGDGNDILDGGLGVDQLLGRIGDDTYYVDNVNDQIIEYGSEGYDVVYAASDYSISANVEALTLTGAANIYGKGNDAANTLTGNSGNNVLVGYGGNDTINGGSGSDTIAGSDGVDDMTGGAGNDSFVFNDPTHTGLGSLADVINDFAQGVDIIDLSGIDTDANTAGDQGFIWIGTAQFSGAAGELRYATANGQTWIAADMDGDTVADFKIHLIGTIDLTASDFVL